MKKNPSRKVLRWMGARASAGLLTYFLLPVFTAEAATFSGTVVDGGLGLSGIRINYSWSSPVSSGNGFVTSGSGGAWSSSGWGPLTDVTFSPSQAGYTWSPSSRAVGTDIVGGGSQSGMNFERNSYSISGTVTVGGGGVGGVTVTLSGQAAGATTTAA